MMRDYFIRVTAPDDEQTVRRKLEALLECGTVRDALGDAGVDATRVALLSGSSAIDPELDKLWQVAREHADESELEHEVGDLQDLTRLCWQFLSDEQRRIVAAAFREQIQSTFE
jgi:hypothetical protein